MSSASSSTGTSILSSITLCSLILLLHCREVSDWHIPLLASLQGGVAERSIKSREASADREAGVVFRSRTQRKTTPAASVSVAARHLLMTQPPLLAVMQGGECAAPTHFDIFSRLPRPLSTYTYAFKRFLRCIIPFRILSLTVPKGCPSDVAISVWLIP